MKYRKIALFLFFMSLFLSVFIFFFGKVMDSFIESIFKNIGICESYLGDFSCYHWSDVALLGFLFLFVNIFFISIFLICIRKESLMKWYKFAKFSIPATFFLVLFCIIYFKPSTGRFIDIVPSIDSFFIFLPSLVFTFMSLVIFLKNKKQSN